MNDNYFYYNGEKYIIEYKDNTVNYYKLVNGQKVVLTDAESHRIQYLMNKKYSSTYYSERLTNLVNDNQNIEKKDIMMYILNWLERLIPEDCRENFYRNIKTLETNIDFDLSKLDEKDLSEGFTQVAGYNISHNTLYISEKKMKEIWKIAKDTNDPNTFFFNHFALALLHELAHMASSNYDAENNVFLCGFDKYPSHGTEDTNRGLTEGYTEAIAMAGIPGTIEQASGYYIETCLVNQLIQLIGNEVMLRSYFSNLGIKLLKGKLQELIDDTDKSFSLFRNIEINYILRDLGEEQSVLGNIQMSLLDYLEKKLDLLFQGNKLDEVKGILDIYGQFMVGPNTLLVMRMNPELFKGVEESIKRFADIKSRFEERISEDTKNISK